MVEAAEVIGGRAELQGALLIGEVTDVAELQLSRHALLLFPSTAKEFSVSISSLSFSASPISNATPPARCKLCRDGLRTPAQQFRHAVVQGLDDPNLGLFTLALLLEVVHV